MCGESDDEDDDDHNDDTEAGHGYAEEDDDDDHALDNEPRWEGEAQGHTTATKEQFLSLVHFHLLQLHLHYSISFSSNKKKQTTWTEWNVSALRGLKEPSHLYSETRFINQQLLPLR